MIAISSFPLFIALSASFLPLPPSHTGHIPALSEPLVSSIAEAPAEPPFSPLEPADLVSR